MLNEKTFLFEEFKMSSDNAATWACAQCQKEFNLLDFKIKSLIYKDRWVCEDCAIQEDEIWLENINKNKFQSM
jgi:protein-arginine kinase activator protein McsA